MAGKELRKGNIHEAIMDFMIRHPQATVTDIAKEIGVGAAWIRTALRSDLFQNRLKEKRDQLLIAEVAPIHEQVAAVITLGLSRMMELIPLSSSLEEVSVVTERLTKTLGMGLNAPVQPAVQVNVVDRQILADARASMVGVPAGPEVAPLELEHAGGDNPLGGCGEILEPVKAGDDFEPTGAPVASRFDPVAEILGGTSVAP